MGAGEAWNWVKDKAGDAKDWVQGVLQPGNLAQEALEPYRKLAQEDRGDAMMLGNAFGQEKSEIASRGAVDPSRFNPYDFRGGWRAKNVNDLRIQAPDAARAEQMGALGMFREAAGGLVPSVAALLQDRAQNQIVRDQAAVAAQARGQDAAAARRQQMLAMGQQGGDAALQNALLRAQEMATARGQYGAAADQLRAGDQQLATDQTRVSLEREKANQAADLAGKQVYEGTMSDLRGNRIAAQGLQNQSTGQMLGIGGELAKASSQGGAALLGGLGAVGAAAVSDEREKTSVRDGDGAADRFLRALTQNEYRYKDPSNGPGNRLGPMAQDLERSDMGRDVVRDTEKGKVVDTNGFLMALASAVGRLNEKVEGRG